MSASLTDQREVDWEDIILKLTAYTHHITSNLDWFRGEGTSTFLMGKEITDYVYGAIDKYLLEPNKFDASKGVLVDYLKYNIIRTLVGNDVRKSENTLSDDVFAYSGNDEDGEDGSYLDRILPHVEALIPDQLDFQAIKEFIETEIHGDKDVENIFLGLYTFGMKRRGIIEEFNMTPSQYDNGMRRLNTVLHRAALIFKQKNQSA